MFAKKRSKRRLEKRRSQEIGKVPSPSIKLWSLPRELANDALLQVLPFMIEKLMNEGRSEPLLFIRKPSIDGTPNMESVIMDPDEEFELLENIMNEYFATCPDGSFLSKSTLDKYGIHSWANIVKHIIQKQSSVKLLESLVIAELLRVKNLDETKIHLIRTILEGSPYSRYRILRDLCCLLNACETDNEKLAFIFGGSILFVEEDEVEQTGSQRMLQSAQCCTNTMKFLISHSSEIFNVSTAKTHELRNKMQEKEKKEIGRTFVRVLYDYKPREKDELELVEGELIEVVSNVNADWDYGRKQIAGQTVEGIIPIIYCEPTNQISEARNLLSKDENHMQEESEPINHSMSNHIVSSVDPEVEESTCSKGLSGFDANETPYEKVIALYPYTKQQSFELSIEADEVLTLLDNSDDDWWKGMNSKGQTGLFPKIYVKAYENHDNMENMDEYFDKYEHINMNETSRNKEQHIAAIPTNRPRPLRKNLSLDQAGEASNSETKGCFERTSSHAFGQWRMDKERFSLCFKWFKKLANVYEDGQYFVRGRDAAEFMLKSGLEKEVVARILEMSDIDNDNKFDRDEFILAHHLAICIKKGMEEPENIPLYLIPASKINYFR